MTPKLLLVLIAMSLASTALCGQDDSDKTQPTPSPETRARIAALIADLADDDVRWNALKAQPKLRNIGLQAAPQLEKALDSKDHQQRHCAAAVIRSLVRSSGYSVSDRLLEVSVEGLRDDQLHGTQSTDNARQGRRFLADHAQSAEKHLVAALHSRDRQQRFISACLIARNLPGKHLKKVCLVLIQQLADNDAGQDALFACRELYLLGDVAAPYLEARENSTDQQQREAIDLILLDIAQPPKDVAERRSRRDLHHLTIHRDDPCLQDGNQWWESLGDRRKSKVFHDIWTRKIKIPEIEAFRRGSPFFKTRFKVDTWEIDHAIMAFGIESRTHFDRRVTLRIHTDGKVERRATSRDGVETWILEHSP